jgi:hypothetical protein
MPRLRLRLFDAGVGADEKKVQNELDCWAVSANEFSHAAAGDAANIATETDNITLGKSDAGACQQNIL